MKASGMAIMKTYQNNKKKKKTKEILKNKITRRKLNDMQD